MAKKKKQKEKDIFFKYWKIIFIIPLVIVAAVIIFLAYFFYAISQEKPPQFFKTDDKDATYTIRKDTGKYNWYYLEYSALPGRHFNTVCSWVKGKKICGEEDLHYFKTVIAKSPIDLSTFIDKPVIVKGEFVDTKTQCIANNCIDIGNWVGFDIKEIQSAVSSIGK